MSYPIVKTTAFNVIKYIALVSVPNCITKGGAYFVLGMQNTTTPHTFFVIGDKGPCWIQASDMEIYRDTTAVLTIQET